MRRRFSTPDSVLWLGGMLLIFSLAGLALSGSAWGDPLTALAPGPENLPALAPVATSTPLPTDVPGPALAALASLPTAPPENSSFLVPVHAAAPKSTTAAIAVPAATAATAATAAAALTAAPEPVTHVPDRLVIPAIGLDAPVLRAMDQLVQIDGQVFEMWDAPPGYAAGWQDNSAPLGEPGNTVLNGHNNIQGAVFARLLDLVEGDQITLFSGGEAFDYVVTNRLILPERDQPLSVRLENARWLLPSDDERVTLVTCWPPYSNTHRLILVAKRVIP